ncbi:MAG: hypoxanthine phosphoribosyltransferase [Nanoarchaeota archaeon]|nr:hypoxanthine phosphoribosyltransferase [Nanoarchaeota archaeon]
MEKIFVGAEEFLLDSFKLAMKIYDSGFRPDFLVGVWRGGTPPAIAIQEFFKFKKIKMNHYPIKTEFYCGVDKRDKEVKISGLKFLEENLNSESSLLIIDDVFDTGITMKIILIELKRRLGESFPKNIKIATIYYKYLENKTDMVPDFYIHKVNSWVVFPHELECLSEDEIKVNKKNVYEFIK